MKYGSVTEVMLQKQPNHDLNNNLEHMFAKVLTNSIKSSILTIGKEIQKTYPIIQTVLAHL